MKLIELLMLLTIAGSVLLLTSKLNSIYHELKAINEKLKHNNIKP